MKSILLIRHAKSNWDDPRQKDFDRPLNERGHRDAPAMAKRLKQRIPEIDQFISSPANRALTTAAYFIQEFGLNKEAILQKPELYHATVPVFKQVITGLNDVHNTIALFSHNGGITDFVNGLTSTKIDNMPTCGIFAVTADVSKWTEFFDEPKDFWFFDYPKNI